MLQQILRDMHVDPELLAELDEDQKQFLFVKIREEQVKRWKEREDTFEKEDKNKHKKMPKSGAKKVDFLQGADGCEWVWVMGEHKNDLSIEEILEREAQEKALKQAEKEALELREKEEMEMKRKIEEEKQRLQAEKQRLESELKRKQEEAAVYQSISEAKAMVAKLEEEKKKREEQEQKRLAELNEEQKRQRRKSFEVLDSVKKRRSMEIYERWKQTRQKQEVQAQAGIKEVEESWKVQEQKAKEADKEMREMAERARMEYRQSLQRTNIMIQAAKAFGDSQSISEYKPPIPPKKHLLSNNVTTESKPKPRPLRPRNRNMVIDWFSKEEKDKGSGKDPTTGKIATWFHGIISRSEAEELLANKSAGTFLVRVSERVWGYTISYKEANRCKHFLVDSTDLGYQFFGANQMIHKSLADLISFHKDTPITISGSELLSEPCGQESDPPDYCELFQGATSEVTSL